MCLCQLEERPAESAAVSRALPAVGTPRAAHDPAQTDIVQILAKIKGRVRRQLTIYTRLASQDTTAVF